MEKIIALTLKLGLVFLILLSAVKVEAQVVRSYDPRAAGTFDGASLRYVGANGRASAPMPFLYGYQLRPVAGRYQLYAPDPVREAQAGQIEAKSDRYRMVTDHRERKKLVNRIKRQGPAFEACAEQLDKLGTLSLECAELLGFTKNEAALYNPTLPGSLPGTEGAQRQQAGISASASVVQPIDSLGNFNKDALTISPESKALETKWRKLNTTLAQLGQDTITVQALGGWPVVWQARRDYLNSIQPTTLAHVAYLKQEWYELLNRSGNPADRQMYIRYVNVEANWERYQSTQTSSQPAALAPKPVAADSGLSSISIQVLMPDSTVVPVFLTKEQERLLAELNVQPDRTQQRADAAENFCLSLMPTGTTAFADAAHRQLAIQSWGVLYDALPDGAQKNRVQTELERARSLDPK